MGATPARGTRRDKMKELNTCGLSFVNAKFMEKAEDKSMPFGKDETPHVSSYSAIVMLGTCGKGKEHGPGEQPGGKGGIRFLSFCIPELPQTCGPPLIRQTFSRGSWLLLSLPAPLLDTHPTGGPHHTSLVQPDTDPPQPQIRVH
ncbi:unnamed protein product [Arctogadus glacialis]